MVKEMLKKAFETFKRKPLEICGFSVVYYLISGAVSSVIIIPMVMLAVIAAGANRLLTGFMMYDMRMLPYLMIIPLIFAAALIAVLACASYVFKSGLYKMYLNYTEENSDAGINNIFDGFKSFWHIVGGALWETLWIVLWFIIPVAGPFLAVYKAYSYRFNIFILIENPNLSIKECLKKSIEETQGKKGSMFLCDLIVSLGIFVISAIIAGSSVVPFLRFALALPLGAVLFLFTLAVSIYSGLLLAAFYSSDVSLKEDSYGTVYGDIKDNYFVNCKQYETERKNEDLNENEEMTD